MKYIYPIDTDQFERIRTAGRVYVDKTDMVYELTHTFDYVFLARPRRFGKSLLCNTLRAYFEGRRELFEGLMIASLERDWTVYPVLHFDMSTLKNMSVSDARSVLESKLARYERVYGKEETANTPGARFDALLRRAMEQTGRQVVVLFDEYDAPIMRLMGQSEQLEEMRTMLREFYQVVKSAGRYLRFTFFTGVTKFSQLSIFSELNNLGNISLVSRYSGLCGITQRELDGALRPCVEQWAVDYGCTTEEAYALLRKQYDGYHFGERSEDVYNPFSLLRTLQYGEVDNYWFSAGTMTSLLEHLRRFPPLNPLELDGMDCMRSQFDIPIEDARDAIPLLFQSGYLAIRSYDRAIDTFRLAFPNEEVRQSMISGLMPIVMEREPAAGEALSLEMIRALHAGDLSRALRALRAYIAGIPYDIITRREWDAKGGYEAFYKLLFYIVFSMVNRRIDTEVRSLLGRADVVIQTAQDIFVIELKVGDTVDNALRQIDTKGYAIPYTADARRLTKCGVAVDPERRNITAWKSVDADGRVVDEQTFE